MPWNPVTNLNAFQKSDEVSHELWLKTTVPLLKIVVNQWCWKIIPNRTQVKIPSFELCFRISQDILIVWVCLTSPVYDVQTSTTIQINRFLFWMWTIFLRKTFTCAFRATRSPVELTCAHVGRGQQGPDFTISGFPLFDAPKSYFQRVGASKLFNFKESWESSQAKIWLSVLDHLDCNEKS